jgi:2-amino-4-hydroxy-6-hydroxymethyldihydropteridine diphosphokinase
VERREISSVDSLWCPAYIAIGSNLNQPRERVLEAFERLALVESTRMELRSRLYLSVPMGPQDQPTYVNAMAAVLTQLTARHLLDALLDIERTMGRDRKVRWGPRIIDLDLIWHLGGTVSEPGLCVPHPGVSERNFVLYPLADVAPALCIPGHGSVAYLMARVAQNGISVLE